ncbi:basic salivary proline-rich protein 1-like [Erpetoichthys calabaricus]|nr:basic salivary proline-rich protein 1-like [Erpetoichthys calabaricus]
MKTLGFILCCLGVIFAAPTPKEQSAAGPPSIEIIMPYGFPNQAFGAPQQPEMNQHNPVLPELQLPHVPSGPVSIEIVYPYGYNGQKFGLPQSPVFSSRGYIKPKVPKPAGKESNEVKANTDDAKPDAPQEQQAPGAPSLEIMVPFEFVNQAFGPHHPQQGFNNPDGPIHQLAQLQAGGHPVSIELMYPYGFSGQAFGVPQQPAMRNPAAAIPQMPSQHAPTGPVSIELLYPYTHPGQNFGPPQNPSSPHHPPSQTPQKTGPGGPASIEIIVPYGLPNQGFGHHASVIPSQGFIKHEVPQPPGHPSLEILYPYGFGNQQQMFPFGKIPQTMTQMVDQQNQNGFSSFANSPKDPTVENINAGGVANLEDPKKPAQSSPKVQLP